MKRLFSCLLLILAIIAVIYYPKWHSLEAMGERRDIALDDMPKEIQIGISWPFARSKDGMRDGLQLALEEINSQRLAAGVPIKLDMRDDEGDADKAKSIAMDFAANRYMSAAIGFYDDGLALRASNIFEASRLLHLVIGANSTALTDHGNQYVLHGILADDKVGRLLATAYPLHVLPRKFAMIWEKDSDEENLAYQYRIAQNALGGEMVYQLSFTREHSDFQLAVNELKDSGAEVIMFIGHESNGNDLLKLAHEAHLNVPILTMFADTNEVLKKIAQHKEGSMLLSFYNPAKETPKNIAFVQKFRARYGHLPDTWAAQGYDALHLLAYGIQTTRSADSRDLVLALRYMQGWEGVNGRYQFDHHGELMDKPIYIKNFLAGDKVEVREIGMVPR